jgi:hypothetical protein
VITLIFIKRRYKMKNKLLTDFPDAFHPLVAVVGDRREDPPASKGDILAYSVSSADILFIQHLKLEKVDIISDKIFVLEEEEMLKRKYGKTNILVIGSPAGNLLARKINSTSIFRFNIGKKAKEQLALQEEILEEIKFDQQALRIYREILLGTTDVNDILKKSKQHSILSKEDKELCRYLISRHKKIGLKNWKDLLHEFDRPGIKDPIDNKIHGASPKPHLDYGLISIARNPFCENNDYCIIFAAGVHAPGTAHCVRLLADKEAFQKHPYGGVLEIRINIFLGWADRLYKAKISWQTEDYKEQDLRITSDFIKIVYPSSKYKEVFLSSPYNRKDRYQEDVNKRIENCCCAFHKKHDTKVIFHNPFELKPVIPFPEEIFKRFKNADYSIHDITKLSKGVLFEFGVSLGLRRYPFLVWDTSQHEFKYENLPRLLEKRHVVSFDFKKDNLCKIMETEIFDRGLQLEGKSPCPLSMGKDETLECEEEKVKKNKKERAFVILPNTHEDKLGFINQIFRQLNIYMFQDVDLPTKDITSKICCGIKRADYCLIDISDYDLDGIITLGLCRAMAKDESTLMSYREAEEQILLPMWQGREFGWSDLTWQEEFKKNIYELVQAVRIRNQRNNK